MVGGTTKIQARRGPGQVDVEAKTNEIPLFTTCWTASAWPAGGHRCRGRAGLPRTAQAIQIVRRRRPLTGKNSKKWSTETVYAITSLIAIQARPPELARLARGHWLRDVTFDEDRSQARTASGPRVMAALRNLVITILRLAGAASIAAALRHHSRHPSRPLQTIMKCLPTLPGPEAPPTTGSSRPIS